MYSSVFLVLLSHFGAFLAYIMCNMHQYLMIVVKYFIFIFLIIYYLKIRFLLDGENSKFHNYCNLNARVTHLFSSYF